MNHEEEQAALRVRVRQWREAAPLLERQREEDIRLADTGGSLRAFTGSAAWAAVKRPPEATSGLVEQQRWFMKLRAAR